MDQYRLDLEKKLQRSPIDDSAILSHVDKVIARHEKHLEKSQRPKRFRLGYLTILAIGIIVIGMMVSPLSDLFYGKTATKAVTPLVEGEGIRIMPEEFLLYKANIEEVNKQPNATPINISDEQIIDNMITDELTVQYAKKLGIVATPAEINKEIAFQRDALEQSPKDNPIRDLMANRIKRSGLSEDEFWKSELARTYYENAILGGKLCSKLAQDGTIIIGNGSGCVNFTKKLLAKNKHKLTIHWSALQDADAQKDELNNNAQKKASLIERMTHPYKNVQFLSGEATIKNDSLSQKFQFSMTRDESNERKFSFVSPGVTGTPSPAYKTTTQTIVAPFSTHAWLAVDVSLWSFAEDESLLGRNVYVIEGKLPAEQAKKTNATSFKLWVDKDMGMVLQKELYDDQGAVVESLKVTGLGSQSGAPLESDKVLKGESIERTLVGMEETAGSGPLKGVAYHVSISSEIKVTPEELSSYQIEVLPASDIPIATIQPISFSKATDGGFLYSLRFETRYGDYTQEELDKFMSARDFIIFITHNGTRYQLSFK